MYPNLQSGKGDAGAYPTGQQAPPTYTQMPAGGVPGQMPAGGVPGAPAPIPGAVNVNVNYGWNPAVLPQPAGAVPAPFPAGQPPPAYSPTWQVLVKQNWERVQGSLKHVNVGARGIYGTNHKHNIFVRNKKGDGWNQCGGKLVQLCAGVDELWGVNKDDEIYRRTISTFDPAGEQDQWHQIPGKLVYVAVPERNGDILVWGVNRSDEIYLRKRNDDKWTKMDGKLVVIAAGHAGVWGINRQGVVYYREGTYRNPGHSGMKWIKVEEDKKMKSVSVGEDLVVAADPGDKLYVRVGVSPQLPTGTHWEQLRGSGAQVNVYGNKVWMTNSNGEIYQLK